MGVMLFQTKSGKKEDLEFLLVVHKYIQYIQTATSLWCLHIFFDVEILSDSFLYIVHQGQIWRTKKNLSEIVSGREGL